MILITEIQILKRKTHKIKFEPPLMVVDIEEMRQVRRENAFLENVSVTHVLFIYKMI